MSGLANSEMASFTKTTADVFKYSILLRIKQKI